MVHYYVDVLVHLNYIFMIVVYEVNLEFARFISCGIVVLLGMEVALMNVNECVTIFLSVISAFCKGLLLLYQ